MELATKMGVRETVDAYIQKRMGEAVVLLRSAADFIFAEILKQLTGGQ
jgi:hypothetical protein